MVVETVWTERWTDKPSAWNTESRNRPAFIWSMIFNTGAMVIQWGNGSSFQQMMLKLGIAIEENEPQSLSHSMNRNGSLT